MLELEVQMSLLCLRYEYLRPNIPMSDGKGLTYLIFGNSICIFRKYLSKSRLQLFETWSKFHYFLKRVIHLHFTLSNMYSLGVI